MIFPPLFHLCRLHRGLINLTLGDGFASRPSSVVMGIQSVTNGGASTEVALLGVQVVLRSPCQTPHCSPKVAMQTWARLFWSSGYRPALSPPISHTPISVMGIFTVPSHFVNVYTAFPPQT